MRTHRMVHRGRGVYGLVVFVGLFVGVVLSFGLGVNQRPLHKFTQVERADYVPAPDPISAALAGQQPTQTLAEKPSPTVAIRAIVVRTGGIAMMAGGKQVHLVQGSVSSLDAVVKALDDTSWAGFTAPDTVRLYAALVIDHVPHFTLGGAVKQVDLVNLPGVFVGAAASNLTIDSVHVRGVTEDGSPAGINPAASSFRPFVVAMQGSRMEISNSNFSNLGYDWNSSYGVSWMDGSTGSSAGSTYQLNYIGVYTDHAHDIMFEGDTYARNVLYGIDPHSASQNLVIHNCVAVNNGAHGIIFSNNVVRSIVQSCTTEYNGENGIMMDLRSTGNTISMNTVAGNKGDGIVLSNSPSNRVADNVVQGNRVGVQISASSVSGTTVQANHITDNVTATQGFSLGPDNQSRFNDGQWLPNRLVVIWIVTGLLTLLWAAVTMLLRRQRGSRHIAVA